MALGEIEFKDILKVLWKELRVAIMVGFVLAAVNFGRLILFGGEGMTIGVASVVAASMFLTVLFAKSIGCTLPMIAKKIHLDPALMASPLITTIVDACSLMILFSIATNVLAM